MIPAAFTEQQLLDNIVHINTKLFTCPSNKRQSCSGALDLARSSPSLCEVYGVGPSWWKSRISYDASSRELIMSSDSGGQECVSSDGGNHGCPGFELASIAFEVSLSELTNEAHAGILSSYVIGAAA